MAGQADSSGTREGQAVRAMARPTILALCVGAALLAFLPSALQAASPQQTTPSPARVVDDSDRVVLKRNVHRLAQPGFDKGRSDPNLPMDRMILALSLRPGAQQALDQLLVRQLDPASSDYHRWLAPEEFGARFGATDEDVRLVTTWLEEHGFRVEEVAKGRGWINFSGTASQAEAAFVTEMHDYQVTGGTATSGADYTLAPGTLTFNPGEKTKTIPIPIVDDALVEGNESVLVTLSTPGGGLALGTISQTTLWIVDND